MRVAIVSILLVLVATIGFEWVEDWLHELKLHNQASPTEQWAGDGGSRRPQTKEPPGSDHSSQDSLKSKQDSSRHSQIAEGILENLDSEQATLRTAHLAKFQLRFIKSSSVIGSAKPSLKQIDRLKDSVAEVTKDLGAGLIVFDLDATSNFEVPFVLYAADDFDLSDRVQRVYEKLEEPTNVGQ